MLRYIVHLIRIQQVGKTVEMGCGSGPICGRQRAGLTLSCHPSVGPNYRQKVGEGRGRKKRKSLVRY